MKGQKEFRDRLNHKKRKPRGGEKEGQQGGESFPFKPKMTATLKRKLEKKKGKGRGKYSADYGGEKKRKGGTPASPETGRKNGETVLDRIHKKKKKGTVGPKGCPPYHREKKKKKH